MSNLVILGGGPAGRAVAAAFDFKALVIEQQDRLDRCIVNRAHGPHFLWQQIPGFEVSPSRVLAHIDGKEATEETINAYRRKVNRPFDKRPWYDEYGPWGTQWAINQWPDGDWVQYGTRVERIDLERRIVTVLLKDGRMTGILWDVLINTLPMPIFWRMTSHSRNFDKHFRWEPVRVWTVEEPHIRASARQAMFGIQPHETYVNWISDHETMCYRSTHHNGWVQYEALGDRIPEAKGDASHVHYPGKIWISSEDALDILGELAKESGVYFAGRYGAWEHTELLHHTYNKAVSLRLELENDGIL